MSSIGGDVLPGRNAEPPGLFAALASKARETSVSALLLVEIAGFLGAIAVLGIGPGHDGLALPLVALGMFGLWGLAEHSRGSREVSGMAGWSRAILLAQIAISIIGTASAIAGGYAIVGRLIGTVVS